MGQASAICVADIKHLFVQSKTWAFVWATSPVLLGWNRKTQRGWKWDCNKYVGYIYIYMNHGK